VIGGILAGRLLLPALLAGALSLGLRGLSAGLEARGAAKYQARAAQAEAAASAAAAARAASAAETGLAGISDAAAEAAGRRAELDAAAAAPGAPCPPGCVIDLPDWREPRG